MYRICYTLLGDKKVQETHDSLYLAWVRTKSLNDAQPSEGYTFWVEWDTPA